MNLLKLLVGVNIFRSVGLSRTANKTKNIAKQTQKDLFFLSQLVVELTTLVATILVGVFKVPVYVYKFIHKNVHKDEVVNEIEIPNNITKLDEYRNKKVG